MSRAKRILENLKEINARLKAVEDSQQSSILGYCEGCGYLTAEKKRVHCPGCGKRLTEVIGADSLGGQFGYKLS